MKWLILFLGVLMNASASILLKLSMILPRKPLSVFHLTIPLINWPLCLGLVLYGATFLIYMAALTRLPLHIAHPILTSGAIMVVAIFSIVGFHEPFHWSTLLGIFLVLVGIGLITVV